MSAMAFLPDLPLVPGVRRERTAAPARMAGGRVVVDGRSVPFHTAGSAGGPVAVFLHGWGLRPNSYRAAIEHVARAGCRVVAPALPGFGGTRELSGDQRSFPGYAAWVGRFLDAVGVDRVDLVVGHSFGGGVATQFAHDAGGRAGSLLLANAIGSPVWSIRAAEVRTMVERPVWDWGRHLGTDLLHGPGMLRILPPIVEDVVPNLLTNPLGFWRTGQFIRRADLVGALADLRDRGLPIEVLWSDRDRLVPRSAFDAVREAAGVEGRVVEGPHAWLVGDPVPLGESALHCLVAAGGLPARCAPFPA
ncbi:MAG: alpha/beta fold hydrolase [Actinomycetota bacterium]|nr:alpha/beta fold hydrolase [Actinomycetota bacterium]